MSSESPGLTVETDGAEHEIVTARSSSRTPVSIGGTPDRRQRKRNSRDSVGGEQLTPLSSAASQLGRPKGSPSELGATGLAVTPMARQRHSTAADAASREAIAALAREAEAALAKRELQRSKAEAYGLALCGPSGYALPAYSPASSAPVAAARAGGLAASTSLGALRMPLPAGTAGAAHRRSTADLRLEPKAAAAARAKATAQQTQPMSMDALTAAAASFQLAQHEREREWRNRALDASLDLFPSASASAPTQPPPPARSPARPPQPAELDTPAASSSFRRKKSSNTTLSFAPASVAHGAPDSPAPNGVGGGGGGGSPPTADVTWLASEDGSSGGVGGRRDTGGGGVGSRRDTADVAWLEAAIPHESIAPTPWQVRRASAASSSREDFGTLRPVVHVDPDEVARLRATLASRPPSPPRSPRSDARRARIVREELGELELREKLARARTAQVHARAALERRAALLAQRQAAQAEMAAVEAERAKSQKFRQDACGAAEAAEAALRAANKAVALAEKRIAALEANPAQNGFTDEERTAKLARLCDVATRARDDAADAADAAREARKVATVAEGATDGLGGAYAQVDAADALRAAQLEELLAERSTDPAAALMDRARALFCARQYGQAAAAFSRASRAFPRLEEAASAGIDLSLARLRREFVRPLCEQRAVVLVRTRPLTPRAAAAGAPAAGQPVAEAGADEDGGALVAGYHSYQLTIDPRTRQLLRPLVLDSELIAAKVAERRRAEERARAQDLRTQAPPRRRRPSDNEMARRLQREFELAISRLDISDLLPRALSPEEKAAELGEVVRVLSSFYPQIRQVLTTYAMKGVVDVGGHESQGAGHANEALTMNRDEFWRLVTDMNVLGRYLPKGMVDVVFVRANWSRDPQTSKHIDEPLNLSSELLPHELLGALCRLAAARYSAQYAADGSAAEAQRSLSRMVERLLIEHLPRAERHDDDPFLSAYCTPAVDQLLERHAAALRVLHGYYASLQRAPSASSASAAVRASVTTVARPRQPASKRPAASAEHAELADAPPPPPRAEPRRTLSLRMWYTFMLDARALGEHAISMALAQRIFVLSQCEDMTLDAHRRLREASAGALGAPALNNIEMTLEEFGEAVPALNNIEMTLEEFGEAVARVAFEACKADAVLPLGLGDEDEEWRALVPADAPPLAFALEQLVGALLTRWKETDLAATRTPEGRRVRAALGALSAARTEAIDVAQRLGVQAATDYLVGRAPALVAKASVGAA